MIIIALVLLVLAVLSAVYNIRQHKRLKEANSYRTITHINYLADTENADRFHRYHQTDLEESEEYHRSAKDLKEDYDSEKVWRYEPYELPFKLEDREVYAKLEDEWIRVGRLKKDVDLNGTLKLYLYINEYKYVTEEGIDRETGDDYFGIECRRTEKR